MDTTHMIINFYTQLPAFAFILMYYVVGYYIVKESAKIDIFRVVCIKFIATTICYFFVTILATTIFDSFGLIMGIIAQLKLMARLYDIMEISEEN